MRWCYTAKRVKEFVTDNWGSLASVTGAVISFIGLGWAIIAARRARSASQAAHQAANETRNEIARHLQAVDLERAIALIQRIKLRHDTGRWDASLEQRQSLREMLSYIIALCPERQTGIRARLAAARIGVMEMGNIVAEYVGQVGEEPDAALLYRILNLIQSHLEELASDLGFGN